MSSLLDSSFYFCSEEDAEDHHKLGLGAEIVAASFKHRIRKLSTVLRACFSSWMFKELIALFRLALPLVCRHCCACVVCILMTTNTVFLSQIVTIFLQQATSFVSLLFVGHLSDNALELDSVGKGCFNLIICSG